MSDLDCVEIKCNGASKPSNSVHFEGRDAGNVQSDNSNGNVVDAAPVSSQSELTQTTPSNHADLARPHAESTRSSWDHALARTAQSLPQSYNRAIPESSVVSIYRNRSHGNITSSLPLPNSSDSDSRSHSSRRRFKFEKIPLPSFDGNRRK